MLKMIANLLKILNSDADPSQISFALGFALLSGLLPFFSPLSLLVLFVVFLLRVNLSTYFLGTAFFAGVAYLLDPLAGRVGAVDRSAARGVTVFCVGVGNEVNRPLLTQLATEAGGLAAFVSAGDDFERQARPSGAS